MSTLWQAGRTWLTTSWLRWHLPVSRQAALDFAELEGDTAFHALLSRIEALEAVLVSRGAVAADDLPEYRRAARLAGDGRAATGTWPPPGYPPARRHGLRVAGGGGPNAQ